MDQLRAILLNEEEGAAQLLVQALLWLEAHPELLDGTHRRGLLETLRTARPAMAGFARLAGEIEAGRSVGDLLVAIRSAEEQIAQAFAALAERSSPMRVVTLSWSSTVREALIRAAASVGEVGVLESQPGGEGKRLYAALAEAGLPATLHPDADLECLGRSCTAGVIGADTVFSDGAVLNKVLSLKLAETLSAAGRPLYVLASTWKSSAQRGADYEPMPGPDAGLFEVVPAERVTSISEETAG